MPIYLHKRVTINSMRGASLFEALVASMLFLIVVAGILPLIAVSLRGETSVDLYTQAANAGRAKLEQVKNYSYAELGICNDLTKCPDPSLNAGPAIKNATGLAYFEVDPYGDDTFNKTQDFLISDKVMLQLGNRQVQATRKVTIEAIDDQVDGLNNSDADGLLDPNTKTIIDYKRVTVTIVFIDPLINKQITQTLATLISGVGGDDESNSAVSEVKPKGGKKPGKKSPSYGHQGSSSSSGGRKGRSEVSDWSSN